MTTEQQEIVSRCGGIGRYGVYLLYENNRPLYDVRWLDEQGKPRRSIAFNRLEDAVDFANRKAEGH